MFQIAGSSTDTTAQKIDFGQEDDEKKSDMPGSIAELTSVQSMRHPQAVTSDINHPEFNPIITDKKNCIELILQQVRSGTLNQRFVEDNVAVFRSLSGGQRKQLADVAIKIDLPKLRPQDDPVTRFLLNKLGKPSAGQSVAISPGAMHFETEDMALDWEHCGVLEIGRYDFDAVNLDFECADRFGLLGSVKGEGTVTAAGKYQRLTKCYKDFKETSQIGVPETLEKAIFRGEPAQATYTPEKIEYVVGQKKRSLKWGAPRINLYKVETGTVSLVSQFSHKHHPSNDASTPA